MIKRMFDVVVSLMVLLFCWPVMLVLFFIIAIKLGRPVFFSQPRPGLDGKVFKLYKFRSMTNETGADGELLPDSKRLTSFGRLLRSLSVDELPSLWNVLKGDMSLVGPRPLLVEYLPLYDKEQFRRHSFKPGITGWAQVNGRNAISWEEKFKFDVWYVDNQSFWLDLKILLMTAKKVVIRDGIAEGGQATMSKFTGSKGKQSCD